MIGPIRRLLIEAGRAKQARAFWQASAEVLSDWAGGAHVRLVYKGLSESGTAEAGSAAQAGESCIADYHDAEGHHVQATFRGLPEGVPTEPLRSGVEIATHLAVMVARRATLERERRLGTFLVELSRWLLAAPERDLLLRYTLQSVVSLVEAQGAFVALRQPDGDTLRIAATVGQCVELDGADIGLTTSTTGRVVRSGEPLLTDNLLAEPDAQVALNPARSARGAMIAPLKTSSGVVGAVGVVRYDQPDAVEPAPPAFGLVDLQYLAAVAAYIAGGLELSEAVTGARAAAERAHAMVDSSPLPLALVDRQGRVLQVNQAGCRLFSSPPNRRRWASTSRPSGCRPARSRSTSSSRDRASGSRGTAACWSPSRGETAASATAPSRGCRGSGATACSWRFTTAPTSCARNAS